MRVESHAMRDAASPCNLAAPMKGVRELDEIRSTTTRTCYVVPITISPLASRLGLIFFNKELRG